MICYAKLNLNTNTAELQQELMKLLTAEKWISRYNQLHYNGTWNVLPLRSPGGAIDRPFAESFNADSFKDTTLLTSLTAKSDIINSLEYKKL